MCGGLATQSSAILGVEVGYNFKNTYLQLNHVRKYLTRHLIVCILLQSLIPLFMHVSMHALIFICLESAIDMLSARYQKYKEQDVIQRQTLVWRWKEIHFIRSFFSWSFKVSSSMLVLFFFFWISCVA